jgi:integrase
MGGIEYRWFLKNLLPTLNIRINSPNSGVAVATKDPLTGPFTDFEFESINNAMAREYADGGVSVTTYTMALIFIATGARPVQIAAMKVKDVKVVDLGTGIDYSIDVPRAKQRREPRSEFRNRPLIKSVGKLVSLYAEAVRSKFSKIMDDPLEAPLFPGYQCKTSAKAGFAHHRLSSSISQTFNRIMRRLKVISERTGGPINITAIRFRRTFATRAAQEGHGLLVIAELLDHSSTRHAGIYIDTRPDIAERIDKAVALELAPIAQAFEGKIIVGDMYAARKQDKSSHIRDLRISNSPLASCGQYEYCNMCAPLHATPVIALSLGWMVTMRLY